LWDKYFSNLHVDPNRKKLQKSPFFSNFLLKIKLLKNKETGNYLPINYQFTPFCSVTSPYLTRNNGNHENSETHSGGTGL
jgi:hypothetical protein